MSTKKTCDIRLTKLTPKKQSGEEKYNLLKEEVEQSKIKFIEDIEYVTINNDYYRNFLSWLLMYDFCESVIANKVLKCVLESIDDRWFKDLANNCEMEKYHKFLIFHNTIKDIVNYLSKCREKQIELNKLSVNLFIDDQKIKLLKNIKRYSNENKI